jgi:hypothetical protein
MVIIMRICLRIVNADKQKELICLSQKATEAGKLVRESNFTTTTLPGPLQAPNPTLLIQRNMETRYSSRKGKHFARNADSCAGLGGRKKRMPSCNGVDTGLNVTRHESEPTSDWSVIARESCRTFRMRKSK